ncbi:hypothetical protein DFH27DRAFT_560747 [Peziza echinospora]|nr:hypothetical protein DFH27DRAFT_560747 [Peziza echinospora]
MTLAGRHLPCTALGRNGRMHTSTPRRLLTPLCLSRNVNVPSKSQINSDVKSVAVLGGGISGLTTAFYLTKFYPGLPITLYEKSDRLGGWLNTKEITTKDGRIQFECGPRTIRPGPIAGLATIDLIRELELMDKLVLISGNSPAAKNRYIYYANQLCEVPSSFRSLLARGSSPVLKGIWGGVLGEFLRKRRPNTLHDESVHDFISRRLNPAISENIASAMFHGIYAGDVKRLSIKSVFPTGWRLEGKFGSMTRGLLRLLTYRWGLTFNLRDVNFRKNLAPPNKWMVSRFEKEGVAMYSFTDGVETLTKALVKYLEREPNVIIKKNAHVKSILKRNNEERPLAVQLKNNLPPKDFSHVISTLFAPETSSLLADPIAPLSSVEAVTVQVVNLYYSNPDLLPVIGFGYLIPQSIPADENPENALGVIFDSVTTPPPEAFEKDETPHAPGTKLTVMMGGHYWNGRDTYPTDHEAIENAREVLHKHLGFSTVPQHTHVTLQRNCIPQYTVGHDSRMEFAHELVKIQFDGRLAVVGSSYGGVGLNDCTRAAYEAVYDLAHAGSNSPLAIDKEEWTGLQNFGDGKGLWGELRPGGKFALVNGDNVEL